MCSQKKEKENAYSLKKIIKNLDFIKNLDLIKNLDFIKNSGFIKNLDGIHFRLQRKSILYLMFLVYQCAYVIQWKGRTNR
jgi:hypothetical protein